MRRQIDTQARSIVSIGPFAKMQKVTTENAFGMLARNMLGATDERSQN